VVVGLAVDRLQVADPLRLMDGVLAEVDALVAILGRDDLELVGVYAHGRDKVGTRGPGSRRPVNVGDRRSSAAAPTPG